MKSLQFIKYKHSGRDQTGQVSVRHQGGAHKRFMRIIDFKRDKRQIEGKVISLEYDPNRTCDIALIQYSDGEKRYILAPEGLVLNDVIVAGQMSDIIGQVSLNSQNLPLYFVMTIGYFIMSIWVFMRIVFV